MGGVRFSTRKKHPSGCFLETAGGDLDAYVAKFYAAFTALEARPTHVPLFARTPDLRRVLLSQDVIDVGGGNTKTMLAAWREWGIPAPIRGPTTWRRCHAWGKPLAPVRGSSTAAAEAPKRCRRRDLGPIERATRFPQLLGRA